MKRLIKQQKFRANQCVKIEHQREKRERRRFQTNEMKFIFKIYFSYSSRHSGWVSVDGTNLLIARPLTSVTVWLFRIQLIKKLTTFYDKQEFRHRLTHMNRENQHLDIRHVTTEIHSLEGAMIGLTAHARKTTPLPVFQKRDDLPTALVFIIFAAVADILSASRYSHYFFLA